MSLAQDRYVHAYEVEADETRVRLSRTLDELASNLTPGRMLDEVLTYAKGGGADFLKGLGNAATANPIPSLLVGVGAAMFLSGKGRIGDFVGTGRSNGTREKARPASMWAADRDAGSRRDPADTHPSPVAAAMSSAGGALRAARGGAAKIGDTTAAAVGAARDTVASAAGSVRDSAAAGLAAVGDAASMATGAVSDAAGAAATSARAAGATLAGARDAVREQAHELRDRSNHFAGDLSDRAATLVREQPLVVAAAGLALGLAIAAFLPKTRFEDEFMGETSEAVKDAAVEVAAGQYRRAKDATRRVADEVKNVAVKEGLSPTAAADAVRELGDKLKSVVTAAGDAAGSTGDASETEDASATSPIGAT